MFARTHAALKEWAIVCEALASGRQMVLIRKGGLEEVKAGFQVTHRDFWLFPTYVHQKPADLIPSVHTEFARVQAAQPPAGALPVQLYATVTDAVKVTDLDRLHALEGTHILSWDAVAARFHYRNRPGVHVLTLRVHRLPQPIALDVKPWYDGCVSWVELDRPLNPSGATPVLSEPEFTRRETEIRAIVGATAAA
jgi:hypothetical protein